MSEETSNEVTPKKRTRAVSTNGGGAVRKQASSHRLYAVIVNVKSKKAETHYWAKDEVNEFLAGKDAARVHFCGELTSSADMVAVGQQNKYEWVVLLMSNGTAVVPQPVVVSWSL